MKFFKRSKSQYSRALNCTVSLQKSIHCNLKGCGCAKSSFIWVSDKLQCVYFETPKTGSSSIKASLIDPVDNGFYQVKDAPLNAAENFSTYFRFAVIRDPVSRMISNYKMFCLSGLGYRHQQIEALFGKLHNQISFEEFIQLADVYKNHHWEQLVAYLPFSGSGISSLMLDLVIETGQLESDWKIVTKKLGIESILGRKNSTASIATGMNVLPESVRTIEEKYKDDMLMMKTYT